MTITAVVIDNPAGQQVPLPGTTRMPPEMTADPDYGDNARLPVVIEPGHCVTWVVGLPHLKKLADGKPDDWKPAIEVMWLRPRSVLRSKKVATRSTSSKALGEQSII